MHSLPSDASPSRGQALCLFEEGGIAPLAIPLHPQSNMKSKMKTKTNRNSQLAFFKPSRRFFGGRLLHRKRRTHRPLSSKESIHLVLRTSWIGCGSPGQQRSNAITSRQNKAAIQEILNQRSRQFGVRIYRRALQSNHIHLILKITNRDLYKKFVRTISGLIASQVMKNQSFEVFKNSLAGDAPRTTEIQGLGQHFWQFRPFSRLVTWGRDFKTCCGYLELNQLEALGFVPYKERRPQYARWLKTTFETRI